MEPFDSLKNSNRLILIFSKKSIVFNSFVRSSCVVSHWNELLCIFLYFFISGVGGLILLQIKIYVTLVSGMRNKHPNIVIIIIWFHSINKKTKVKDPTHFDWISHDKKTSNIKHNSFWWPKDCITHIYDTNE